MIIDFSEGGVMLIPGDPDECPGNGSHDGIEICCDECDFFLDCFPQEKAKKRS